MSVLVVGMSHQSAPVALLEKLSMDSAVQDSACGQLVAAEPLSEAMIISTCNRMEVYTVTSSFHAGVQEVVRVLTQVSGVGEQALRTWPMICCSPTTMESRPEVTDIRCSAAASA